MTAVSRHGAYDPPPGTIPHRAIAYLRSLPAGSHVPSASLAEVLDVDSTQIGVYLITARRKGALVASRIEGRGNALQWSLGTGQALDLEVDERLRPRDPNPQPDPALRSVFDFAQREGADAELAPEPAPEASATTMQAWVEAEVAASAPPPDAAPAAPAHDDVPSHLGPTGQPWPTWTRAIPAEPPPAHVDHPPEDDEPALPRVALWDDGALTIVRGVERIEFDAEEARHIYRYLNRVLVGGYPS